MFHPDFRLNGKSFRDFNELLQYIDINLPEHHTFLTEFFNDTPTVTAHTSGSTGTPKIIRLKKKHLLNSAQKTIDFFELPPGTKALLNLSPEFIAGKMMWVRALLGGWHLDVINPTNKLISKQLNNSFYDFGAMVPLQVYGNINFLNRIDKLIVGGGSVSSGLQNKIAGLPNKIFATFGMTETITHIAVKALNNKAETFKGLTNKYYQVLKNIQIDTDERNCLIINAPDITENKVVTNDLVQIIDDKHFEWLGRYDNIINSGAVKIIPEQVEAKLASYINARFFIGSLPDTKLGEKIVLFIEGNQSKIQIPNIKNILSKYEMPKNILFVARFSETESGKINKKQTISNIYNR
jgi:O-succinylbenzoic acid--CoA ligase